MAEPDRLHRADNGLLHHQSRIDVRRDTKAFVTRNFSGHIHITLGNDQATIIVHPHAAVRLIADMQAVLDGAEHAHD